MQQTLTGQIKKINVEQLAQLFEFTRKHYVEYYDLQCELADHLAHSIEQRWEEEPSLSFDEALQAEFKKFGIFGFSDIVAERQNALFKRYYRLVWHEFRSAFTPPLILIILATALGMYCCMMAWHYSYSVFMLGFFVISTWRLSYISRQYRRNLKKTGRKWLFEEIIFSCGGFGVMMTVPIQFVNFVLENKLTQVSAMAISVILALLFIYDHVVLFRMPATAKTHLKKVYPEYGMENLA
ncbi:hypothetical protein [Flavobacterium sp.]|uniref:hypothetical protein n=1 Tax=Flavobacterium sp. TaxID=239 RepID=UPI004034487D